jgi:hypothetical protein
MRGRLVILNPESSASSAALSPLVVEDQGRILLCGDDWSRLIQKAQLEVVTTEDVRAVLPLPDDGSTVVLLSGVRELPEGNPLSPEFLRFVEEWWHEETMRLHSNKYATLAS